MPRNSVPYFTPGRPWIFSVELTEDKDARLPAVERAERVFYRCLEEGLSFKVSSGSVLTLSPPMTIERDDLDRALGIVERAIMAG